MHAKSTMLSGFHIYIYICILVQEVRGDQKFKMNLMVE